ncbi:MAG: polysaccharide biosynthesis tyrosine autokinase [Myxococcales bacterium]|nr:polysaccharide biosynthesis tyrosine autokinase [Myxococcales bacterium]
MESATKIGTTTPLQHYAQAVFKRRWIALAFFVGTVVSVVLYTRAQPPIYRATVTILIERTPPRVLAGTAEVVEMGSTNYWSNKEYYQTQYNIIQSREISLRVVEQLGLLGNNRVMNEWFPSHLQSGIQIAGLDVAQALAAKIEVVPRKDSMLVDVSVEDRDAVMAMELVNGIARAYRDYNLDRKQDLVQAADVELASVVEKRRIDKELAEKAVVEFESDNAIGTIANERRVVDQAIVTGEATREELLRRLDVSRARVDALSKFQKVRDIFDVGHADVLQSPLVSQLKQEHVRMTGELAKLETDYLDKHPAVQSVRNRLSVVERTARDEISNIVKAARATLQELESQLHQQDERLIKARAADAALADRQLSYERLVASRDQARAAYEKVSGRLTETKMTGEIKMNNVDILDVAREPSAPVKPNLKLNLALGIMLGLLGGIALAILIDRLDNTIKGSVDLEELGVTVLGVVPTLRDNRRERKVSEEYRGPIELYIHHRPNSAVAELSRTIRTNLMFMATERSLRTLLVTSPGPQEGKTTVAVNLGVTLAANGARVVIVDTDMRRPRVHQAFDASFGSGVSNYLISDVEIVDLIQHTPVPNLDFLPCGPIPPNPAELIHTAKFGQLIRSLKGQYDTVIFDSPPINVVTDAQILANQVDGVVLVVRAGETSREALAHGKRQLDTAKANILGCVLNNLDIESRGHGYYYGRDRYGYAYKDSQPNSKPST